MLYKRDDRHRSPFDSRQQTGASAGQGRVCAPAQVALTGRTRAPIILGRQKPQHARFIMVCYSLSYEHYRSFAIAFPAQTRLLIHR
jgi:hypothetical protein